MEFRLGRCKLQLCNQTCKQTIKFNKDLEWPRSESYNYLMDIISLKSFVATCLGDKLGDSWEIQWLRTESPESRGHDENWPLKFRQDFSNNLALKILVYYPFCYSFELSNIKQCYLYSHAWFYFCLYCEWNNQITYYAISLSKFFIKQLNWSQFYTHTWVTMVNCP